VTKTVDGHNLVELYGNSNQRVEAEELFERTLRADGAWAPVCSAGMRVSRDAVVRLWVRPRRVYVTTGFVGAGGKAV